MTLPLPPQNLRMNSKAEREDAFYLASATALIENLKALYSLENRSKHTRVLKDFREMAILDYGCGTARLLQGMSTCSELPKKYTGIDVQENQIEWCKKSLSPKGNYHFFLSQAHNERYNPYGAAKNDNTISDAHLNNDLVIARSVLTHMRPIEAQETLYELRRALGQFGRAYITVNVRNDAPAWTDTPEGIDHANNLLKVQFNKSYFENMLDEADFVTSVFIENFHGQCVYFLRAKEQT